MQAERDRVRHATACWMLRQDGLKEPAPEREPGMPTLARFARRLEDAGLSPLVIARDFEAEGYHPSRGAAWHPSGVVQLLAYETAQPALNDADRPLT